MSLLHPDMLNHGHYRVVRLIGQGSVGAMYEAIDRHTSDTASVSFAPDGQTVASASGDGTVRLWQLSIGHRSTGITQGRAGHGDSR